MIFLIKGLLIYLVLGFNLSISQDSTTYKKEEVGPIFYDLPLLDSLINDTLSYDLVKPIIEEDLQELTENNLFTSGTFFRSLDISTIGNESFSGGLRFQMSGKLSEELEVSGVISDQKLPFQPDGNTASLDEIDQIFINATHSNGDLTAGDISISSKKGRFNTFKRNLSGIKTRIKINTMDYDIAYGKNKGSFRRLSFKGEDGNQGPYFLTNENGKRNIIVSAGSEEVWLNGKKLIRGDNNDYVINYSNGEIFFNSKNLIFYDSDIDVEFQYQKDMYTQNFLNAALEDKSNDFFQYSLSFSREKDDFKSISDFEKSMFSKSDVLFQNGAVADSTGDYVLYEDILIYDPINEASDDNRYKVVFNFDPDGKYIRKISDNNIVYYVYNDDLDKDTNERFSPGIFKKAPSSKGVINVTTKSKLNSGFVFENEISISDKNANTLASDNIFKKRGNAFQSTIRNEPFRIGKMDALFSFDHWQTSKNFDSLNKSKRVSFNEEWDISDSNYISDEKFSSLSTTFNLNEKFNTTIDFSQFSFDKTIKNKKRIVSRFFGKFINELNVDLFTIETDKKFSKGLSKIYFTKKSIKPFVSLVGESREGEYNFFDYRFGLVEKENEAFSLIFGERTDKVFTDSIFSLSSNTIFQSQRNKFIQFDMKKIKKNGLSRTISFRQKIANTNNIQNSTISSFRSIINYRKKESPIRLNFLLNGNNSLYQIRSMVYDSVGIGLGNFRFDKYLNEYVEDVNGDYKSYNILSGESISGSRIDGFSKFDYNFSKTEFEELKPLKFRSIVRLDLHSKDAKLFGAIDKQNTQFYNYSNKSEFIYQKNRSMSNYRIYYQKIRNFNGMDVRGWKDMLSNKFAIESSNKFLDDLFIILNINSNNKESLFSNPNMINRRVRGFSNVAGFKKKIGSMHNVETKFNFTSEKLFLNDIEKKISSNGIEMNYLYYNNKSRVNIKFLLTDVKGYDGMPYEVANGNANGVTQQLNASMMFDVGNNFFIKLNAMYKNDIRYKNMMSISGELGANF